MLNFATESEFQQNIEKLLQIKGWSWIHVFPVTNSRGKTMTYTRGTKGWPDLTCVKWVKGVPRFLILELKTPTGTYTPNQKIFWQRTWGYLPAKDEIRVGSDTMIGVATHKSYDRILAFIG